MDNRRQTTEPVSSPKISIKPSPSAWAGSAWVGHTPHHNLDEGCNVKMVQSERSSILLPLHGQIVLAEVLAAQRQLMMLQVGQEPLQLKEETLARLVAVGVHVEGN